MLSKILQSTENSIPLDGQRENPVPSEEAKEDENNDEDNKDKDDEYLEDCFESNVTSLNHT